ncbi:MAG: hypothetical protein JSV89_19455 [Spirochaetaceae bacterium]|nr:MAG: hypothetical protein JSV89_19455 [Spirochaetaceae bacterium]
MRWIEIIEIRSLSNTNALLDLNLQALMADPSAEKKLKKIEIYRHGDLATDWSIHLHYVSDSIDVGESPFGVRFASLMKEFGFVHHSIWKEMRWCGPPTGE